MPDRSAVKIGDVSAERLAKWEVELMCCTVDRIEVDRCCHIEPCQFEPEAHPTRPSKEVNPNWPYPVLPEQRVDFH